MKVTFDLDLSIPYEEQSSDEDLRKYIIDQAIYAFVEKLWYVEGRSFHCEIGELVNKIAKDHQDEIVEKIIERVADKIASKRAIKEITPKASEIAAIDNENVEYFMKLIDKAIAKRFKEG